MNLGLDTAKGYNHPSPFIKVFKSYSQQSAHFKVACSRCRGARHTLFHPPQLINVVGYAASDRAEAQMFLTLFTIEPRHLVCDIYAFLCDVLIAHYIKRGCPVRACSLPRYIPMRVSGGRYCGESYMVLRSAAEGFYPYYHKATRGAR